MPSVMNMQKPSALLNTTEVTFPGEGQELTRLRPWVISLPLFCIFVVFPVDNRSVGRAPSIEISQRTYKRDVADPILGVRMTLQPFFYVLST